ncbi:MAG TPA: TIGR04053 family radical SAM/SPASM domain-containing protein [Jiangellaceae bacterium]
MAPSRASVAAPSSGVRVPRHAVGERPFIVIWEATRACPLACRHCRAVAVPDRHPDELSTDEAQDLLGQVADFGRPPPLFVITGGDPFQRPDLCRLVRHGTELGVPVAVAPSGTPTLTAAALEAVYEAGAKAVSLSLDGSTAATHDEFRGVEGVYGWTLDAWRTARRLGLRVQVNTTVTGHNLDDLADIGAVVREQGAMLWSLFLLVPTGRGRLLPALTPHDVEDVLNFGYDIGAVLATKTTEAHHFRRVVIQRRILEEHDVDHESLLGLGPQYRRLRARLHTLGLDAGDRRARRPPLDINAGRGFAFVSHTGDVHPSGFLPLAAGNVRQEPLVDIYRAAPLFTGLRDTDSLTGRCGECEFRTVCGGSRSRAFAVTGDPHAEDPWCSYRPGSFPFQDDLARMIST